MIEIEDYLPLGTLFKRFTSDFIEYLKIKAFLHRNSLIGIEIQQAVQHFKKIRIEVGELVSQQIMSLLLIRLRVLSHKVLEVLQVAEFRFDVDETFVLLG